MTKTLALKSPFYIRYDTIGPQTRSDLEQRMELFLNHLRYRRNPELALSRFPVLIRFVPHNGVVHIVPERLEYAQEISKNCAFVLRGRDGSIAEILKVQTQLDWMNVQINNQHYYVGWAPYRS